MAVAGRLGVDELSMRKVAQQLGRGRDEPLHLRPGPGRAVRADDRPRLGGRRCPTATCRGATRSSSTPTRRGAMYQEHPWLVRSNLWRMPLGPHVLDVQEDLYRAVPDRARRAHASRGSPASWSRTSSAPPAAPSPTPACRPAPASRADEYWESRAGFWGTYYSAERFPTMTRIWEAGGFDAEPRRRRGVRPRPAARRRRAPHGRHRLA